MELEKRREISPCGRNDGWGGEKREPGSLREERGEAPETGAKSGATKQMRRFGKRPLQLWRQKVHSQEWLCYKGGGSRLEQEGDEAAGAADVLHVGVAEGGEEGGFFDGDAVGIGGAHTGKKGEQPGPISERETESD